MGSKAFWGGFFAGLSGVPLLCWITDHRWRRYPWDNEDHCTTEANDHGNPTSWASLYRRAS